MMFVNRYWKILFFFSLLIVGAVYASVDNNLGYFDTEQQDPFCFHASYHIGPDYDISSFIDDAIVTVVKPYVVKFQLHFNRLTVGSFLGISIYQPNDQRYAPITDLSHTANGQQKEESTFFEFKFFKGVNNSYMLAPVMYKRGYRYTTEEKDVFFDPFDGENPITDIDSNPVGAPETFLVKLMSHAVGKGASIAEEIENMISSDSHGNYSFLLHINPAIKGQLFFIIAFTKISIITSQQGLRSPIITTPLRINHGGKS